MAKHEHKTHDPTKVPYAPHDGKRKGFFPPELQAEAEARHAALPPREGRMTALAAEPLPQLPAYNIEGGMGTVNLVTAKVRSEMERIGYTVYAPGEEPTPPDPEPPDPPDPTPDVPNPAPTKNGLSIANGARVDFGWKSSFASWWCDHKTDFEYRKLVIDGRLILPNPSQLEPKN